MSWHTRVFVDGDQHVVVGEHVSDQGILFQIRGSSRAFIQQFLKPGLPPGHFSDWQTGILSALPGDLPVRAEYSAPGWQFFKILYPGKSG